MTTEGWTDNDWTQWWTQAEQRKQTRNNHPTPTTNHKPKPDVVPLSGVPVLRRAVLEAERLEVEAMREAMGVPVLCSTIPFPSEIDEMLRERLEANAREAEQRCLSAISSVQPVEEVTLDDIRASMLRLMPLAYRERFEEGR